MARKIRVEFEGAVYHVINRGNYRSWIFESQGARESFLKWLAEACLSMEWRLHGWVLMSNHYHLCLETPKANLVAGMKWLQSTFANRFNRYRGESGHVFQGRYKAILLDAEAVGAVCHYINLNPVRAGLVEADRLQSYKDSGFHQLWYPARRWPFLLKKQIIQIGPRAFFQQKFDVEDICDVDIKLHRDSRISARPEYEIWKRWPVLL